MITFRAPKAMLSLALPLAIPASNIPEPVQHRFAALR